jgi:hypothetical protein
VSTIKESPQLIKVESQWFMEEFPNPSNFGPFQIVNYSKLNHWCSQRKAKVSQQPFSTSHEIYICFGSLLSNSPMAFVASLVMFPSHTLENLSMVQGSLFVLFVSHVKISQTMLPFAMLSNGKPSMSRGAPSWFHNVLT